MSQSESPIIHRRVFTIDKGDMELPIIGRREFDPHKKELKIGDELPTEYREVVDGVRSRSRSTSFTEQAIETVYYFYALDTGTSLLDAEGQPVDLSHYADLIASLPLINLLFLKQQRQSSPQIEEDSFSVTQKQGVQNVIRRRVSIDFGNPQTSFPSWVLTHRGEQIDADADSDSQQLRQFYESWVLDNAVKQEPGRYGLYAYYPAESSPPESLSGDNFFKGYVEVETDQSSLKRAFLALRQENLHPHESKLFDGSRVVLYWHSDLTDDISRKIQTIFAENGVHFRGPGQDSYYFVLQEDGSVQNELRVSNDGALGEGGHSLEFRQDSFDPIIFLKRYLEQCYRYWRNPLNPYQISYVPAFDKRKNGDISPLTNQQNTVSHELVVFEEWIPTLFQK